MNQDWNSGALQRPLMQDWLLERKEEDTERRLHMLGNCVVRLNCSWLSVSATTPESVRSRAPQMILNNQPCATAQVIPPMAGLAFRRLLHARGPA